MRSQAKLFSMVSLIVLFASIRPSIGEGATIAGTVKGPDGAPFQGAFVQAQSAKTKITVNVLSDSQGRYRIENLAPGEYRVQIQAVGYRPDPHTGINLKGNENLPVDFTLQNGTVSWSDISLAQAAELFPPSEGRDLMFKECSICHQFQNFMAPVRYDGNGWKQQVANMRQVMHANLAQVTDDQADKIAAYITTLFGPNSVLPKSPADNPKYKQTVPSFSNDAMNIVYVEYNMPGPHRMPFSAAPDKDGYMWIPNAGPANIVTRLDPKTGEMKDFRVPHVGTAGVHSAIPAPNGMVYLAEQAANQIGRWDPSTQQVTEYPDIYYEGKEGTVRGGEKHTLRIAPNGKVWASAIPLSMFDPETKKFTRFDGVNTYDVKPDRTGDFVWFTSPGTNKIGKVDTKTMKVSQWTVPTPGGAPRRLEITADGIVWAGEFGGGKMARFDPKTETFKEYTLPGSDPSPYGMGVDSEGYIWYDSHHMDYIGRFDPRTGNTVEYPFPHKELAFREFFRDSQGNMWYGSSPNNLVGYLYLAKRK
jgi:virginiamycin B lyase